MFSFRLKRTKSNIFRVETSWFGYRRCGCYLCCLHY